MLGTSSSSFSASGCKSLKTGSSCSRACFADELPKKGRLGASAAAAAARLLSWPSSCRRASPAEALPKKLSFDGAAGSASLALPKNESFDGAGSSAPKARRGSSGHHGLLTTPCAACFAHAFDGCGGPRFDSMACCDGVDRAAEAAGVCGANAFAWLSSEASGRAMHGRKGLQTSPARQCAGFARRKWQSASGLHAKSAGGKRRCPSRRRREHAGRVVATGRMRVCKRLLVASVLLTASSRLDYAAKRIGCAIDALSLDAAAATAQPWISSRRSRRSAGRQPFPQTNPHDIIGGQRCARAPSQHARVDVRHGSPQTTP